METEFDEKTFTKTLKIDARAIGIPSGAAESFIEHTIKDVRKALKAKPKTTNKELTRIIVKELKKYNADLAYVYENRDRII